MELIKLEYCKFYFKSPEKDFTEKCIKYFILQCSEYTTHNN